MNKVKLYEYDILKCKVADIRDYDLCQAIQDGHIFLTATKVFVNYLPFEKHCDCTIF